MKKQTKCGSPDKTLVGMEESAGAVIQRCSVKKVFLKKIVSNSQENNYAGVPL